MKTLIALLLFSSVLSAQNLDTIRVRNLTLQAQDWAWFVGKAAFNDSVSVNAFYKIRTAVRAVSNIQWTSNVTIDSLPGRVVWGMYQMVKQGNAGEIVSRYTAITTAIAAKTVMSYFIGITDGSVATDYTNSRNKGKYLLIDL